jgi:SAM-dependent methyltransferase
MSREQRATIFGGEAETYDTYRPSYPDAAIDLLAAPSPRLAVDVGCGTGKAARLLLARGIRVLGVEPDPRMAEIARGHGVDVDVTTIEEWTPIDCDLMIAAQSWHWVDPVRGASVAAQALRTGGWWAALWNYENDPAFSDVRRSVYRRFAPGLIAEMVTADDADRRIPVLRALSSSGAFGHITTHDFGWTDATTVDSIVRRVATQSAHRLLDRDTASTVHDALRSDLGGPDEVLELTYVTRVLTTQRL